MTGSPPSVGGVGPLATLAVGAEGQGRAPSRAPSRFGACRRGGGWRPAAPPRPPPNAIAGRPRRSLHRIALKAVSTRFRSSVTHRPRGRRQRWRARRHVDAGRRVERAAWAACALRRAAIFEMDATRWWPPSVDGHRAVVRGPRGGHVDVHRLVRGQLLHAVAIATATIAAIAIAAAATSLCTNVASSFRVSTQHLPIAPQCSDPTDYYRC